MKRLLFVANVSPLQPFSGFAYRALGFLQWLVERFRVTLVFEGQSADLAQSFIPLDRFEDIRIAPPSRSHMPKIRGLFGLMPYHHAVSCHQGMLATIESAMQARPYDLIWLNKSVHFPAFEGRRDLPPLIIDQHAAETMVWDNLIRNDPRRYARLFFIYNKYRVLRYEDLVYRRISGVLCISKSDQEITNRLYPQTKTICIPQGVDIDYYRPESSAQADPDTLLFSGTGAVRNLEAIKTLISSIMPLVHRSHPNLRLLWIGSVNRQDHPFLDIPWVETTGFVPHTPPFFKHGMIYVSPFTMGEGMKTKIVEAMAMGKVIVSTPLGVCGIETEGLPFIRVCPDPQSFAEAIVNFRTDANLAELGVKARAHAVERYSWDLVLEPLASFIEECLNRKS